MGDSMYPVLLPRVHLSSVCFPQGYSAAVADFVRAAGGTVGAPATIHWFGLCEQL